MALAPIRPALDVEIVRVNQPQVLRVGSVEVLKPEYYECGNAHTARCAGYIKHIRRIRVARRLLKCGLSLATLHEHASG